MRPPAQLTYPGASTALAPGAVPLAVMIRAAAINMRLASHPLYSRLLSARTQMPEPRADDQSLTASDSARLATRLGRSPPGLARLCGARLRRAVRCLT